jgi:hypothetical protein
MLAAGIVFFLVSLKMVLVPYEHPVHSDDRAPSFTAFDVAFPLMVTPYGIAAGDRGAEQQPGSGPWPHGPGARSAHDGPGSPGHAVRPSHLKYLGVPLKLLGAVLGVLLLALSVQIILDALQRGDVLGRRLVCLSADLSICRSEVGSSLLSSAIQQWVIHVRMVDFLDFTGADWRDLR